MSGVAAYYLIELPGAKLLGAIYGMLNIDGTGYAVDSTDHKM